MNPQPTSHQLHWLTQQLRCDIKQTHQRRPFYRMSPWEPFNTSNSYASDYHLEHETIYEIKISSHDLKHMIQSLEQQDRQERMVHAHAAVQEAYMNMQTLIMLLDNNR